MEMHLPGEMFTANLVLGGKLLPVRPPDNSGQPVDHLPGSADEPIHYLGYGEASGIGGVVDI